MLDGKLVLVTGATRGIGKSIALTLGNSGATVIGTATSEIGAENISKMLFDNEISGKGIVLDVTDNDQISSLSEEYKKRFWIN
jgi:3-oxoacyl-[acyl-carrier protein] reductase